MSDRQTMHEFVVKHGIRATHERAASNPNMADDEWSRGARHWRVTLYRDRKSMTVHFSQGSAHTDPPDAADVLNALALNSSGVENTRDLDDFAAEFGYEFDPSCKGMTPARAENYGLDCDGYFKAKKVYAACKAERTKLKSFLGDAAYKELLYETESL